MQPPLWPPEPRNPLPRGTGHYVPAIQFQRGELTALNKASSSTWAGLTPLVSVVARKSKKEELTASSVRGWIKRIATAVADHPFYLDTIKFRPDQCVKLSTGRKGMPALAVAYEQARKQQLVFVPVVKVGHTNDKTYEIIREAVWKNGLGVALRYEILNTVLPSGMTHTALLQNTLEAVEVEPSIADLILDLRYLSPDDDIRDDYMVSLIDQTATGVHWRNVVLLATGMPSTLSCVTQGTLGAIDRPEWKLWQALNKTRVGRMPTYGDYAIQHPTPPKDGGPGMRANIRYTTREKTLIVRGEGEVREKGNVQYIDLCRKLIANSDYEGANYSWGDWVIQECANGMHDPQNQTLWRGVGTSHHFRVVTEQLAAFGSPGEPAR